MFKLDSSEKTKIFAQPDHKKIFNILKGWFRWSRQVEPPPTRHRKVIFTSEFWNPLVFHILSLLSVFEITDCSTMVEQWAHLFLNATQPGENINNWFQKWHTNVSKIVTFHIQHENLTKISSIEVEPWF